MEFDSSWNKTISKNFTQLGAFIPTLPINLVAELSNNHRIELDRSFAQELSALKDNFSEGLSECLVNQILSADLIVIDGHYRNCFLELSSSANPNSIIVLDNAERSEYSAGIEHMIKKGWNEVEFTGLGPVNPYEWTTTIFFKL